MPTNNKLLDVLPEEVWALLVCDCDGKATLYALVQHVRAGTRHVVTVVNHRRNIPGIPWNMVGMKLVFCGK